MRTPLLLSCVAAFALLSGTAHAGSYLRLEAGIVSKGSGDGFTAIATVGTPLSGNFNLEGEFSYANISDKPFSGVELEQNEIAALANLTTSFPLTSDIGLILGAGIGVASVNVDATYWFGGSASASETGFAFQVLAGLEMALDKSTDISVMYRRRDVDVSNSDEASDIFSVGLTFAL